MKLRLTVREVMNRNVKKVRMNEKIGRAARIMKKNRIGSVLVTDKGNIEGIVTETDIVYKYVAMKKGRNVSDIMTKKLVKISPNKTIEDASKLMSRKNIEKLPVFSNGKVVGIITATDIVKVEPALLRVLNKAMKREKIRKRFYQPEWGECEVCENYSENIKDIDGVYMCEECREERGE
jgi:CBS domain-containing protein